MRLNENFGAVEVALVVDVAEENVNETVGFDVSVLGASAGFGAATGMFDLNAGAGTDAGFTGTTSSGGLTTTVCGCAFGWALGASG